MPLTPSLTLPLASRHHRLRLVRVAARWIALVVILLGSGGVLGWIFGVSRLASPLSTFAPIPLLGALALTANGVALWGFASRREQVHIGACLAAMTFGVISLAASLTPESADRSGASLAGAILGLSTSATLFVATIRSRPNLAHVTFGVGGFVLVALSLVVIGVRMLGAFDAAQSRALVGASPQGLTCSLLFGICFLSFVWAEGLATSEPPEWVPGATAIASLATVLLLWQALDSRESEQLSTELRLAAEQERRTVYREVGATAQSFGRAADWAASGATAAQITRDFASLLRDVPGLTAVARFRRDDGAAITVPSGADFGAALTAWSTFTRTRGVPDTLIYLPLDAHAEHFAVYAPVCAHRACDGAIAGVIDARALFATTLSGSARGFLFVITRNGAVIGADSLQLPVTPYREDIDIRLGDANWQLAAIPTQATLNRLRTSLPGVVLFMGLIVSALLPIALRLGQTAWRGARDAERGRLALALERSTDGIWDWDLESGFAVRSTSLWRHLGYDPERVAPEITAWTALIHDDDRADVEAALTRHIGGETTNFEAEYRVRDAGGAWHTIVDRGRVVERSPEGAPRHLLGIVADVSETRRAEEARDSSERRFRAMFDSGFQFQLLLDSDGHVLEVNRAALHAAGVTADAVLGQPVWNTLWWASGAETSARLRESVDEARVSSTVQYDEQFPETTGMAMILEIGLKAIIDAQGNASQLLLEARDVTARRRVEAALQEIDTLAAMGGMAARVAHEINNPLAGIQYSFLLIKDAVPEDHPHYAYVGAIEREISRIATVTRQLYETYRPEPELSANASLATVIGDAVSFLAQVNRTSKVRIETDLSGAPSVVPVATAVLRQIVYNLVQNAMDASPPDGTVRVTATASGGVLELRVTDSGPGVPAQLRERIFEPFFSTKDARMRTSGMGLGLALVKKTVVSAGGSIRVENPESGGATFIVSLPVTMERVTR